MTYGGQGTNKSGVHAKDHAIICTENPVRFHGEYEKGLTKEPITVEPVSKRHKLDQASRLNYAKLYTVEYNVKVWFIGKIHSKSEYQLTTDYNVVHPPMPSRGTPPSSADTYAYTGGAADVYQAPYSSYPGPSTAYPTPNTTYPAGSSTPAYNSDPMASAYLANEYTPSTTSYSAAQVDLPYQSTGHESSQAPSYQIDDNDSAGPSSSRYARGKY